jgi:hypothetical protein
MDTIFAFTVLHFSSDLQFNSELPQENTIKRTKSNGYSKHFYNCAKMEHVSLHSVGTYHKKFGWEKKNKIKYTLSSVHGWHSAKHNLPSVYPGTLDKVFFKNLNNCC